VETQPPPSTQLLVLPISRGCGGSLWPPLIRGHEWKTVSVSIFFFYGFLMPGCRDRNCPKTIISWSVPRFWSMPIFCNCLAWRAGTTRQRQYGRHSDHISWPASCSAHEKEAKSSEGEHQRGVYICIFLWWGLYCVKIIFDFHMSKAS
jgi:hypothetical protein